MPRTNNASHQTEEKLLEDKVELAKEIWSEQQEIIQFADGKANFNLLVCTALFAGFGLGSGIIGSIIKTSRIEFQILLLIFGSLAFGLIVASFLSALWVVLPRFGETSSQASFKPTPHFRYIAEKIHSPEQLQKEICEMNQHDLLTTRVYQAFELAKIANTKMKWTSRSVWLTIASVLSTTIFLLIVVTTIIQT